MAFSKCTAISPGNIVCDVWADVKDLIPQSTYHVRLVVEYEDKYSFKWVTLHSNEKTFSTWNPPSATTGDATDLTSISAVLHGVANPMGNETVAWMEYNDQLQSLSCLFNCPSPLVKGQNSIGTGTAAVNVAIKVDGLQAGKSYNYRLAAKSKGGTTYGQYKQFFTPSKPIVNTNDAEAVGTRSATLTGWVNPAGFDTMYYFEYGETSAYGIKKNPTYAGKDTSGKNVNLKLDNSFSPGKTYHYRIVANNTLGYSYGGDRPFTTQKLVAPSVTTGIASDITTSAATLNGIVNPHNDQTMWHFEYRKGTGVWLKTVNAGANVEYDWNIKAQIFQLDPNSTYTYKLTATNGAGTVTGEEKTFKTNATALPTATTGPTKSVSTTSAVITGTVNPNGTATSFWFWYGLSKTYTTHTAGQTGLTGTSAIPVYADLNNLLPNTTYYYRISANNIKGAVQGEDKTFTTASMPQEVTTGAATNIRNNAATIAAAIKPNGLTMTWWFEYGTTVNYGSSVYGQQETGGTITVTRNLAGLKPGTLYHYRIASQSSAGKIYGKDRTFTTLGGIVIPGNLPVR
jgi:hypothetical protein